MENIVVSGNCQTGGVSAALAAMLPGTKVIPYPVTRTKTADGKARLRAKLRAAGVWVTSLPEERRAAILGSMTPPNLQVVSLPLIQFRAFHPDVVHIRKGSGDGAVLEGPFGTRYNSLIVFWSYLRGLSVDATERLFGADTFAALGYLDRWDAEVQRLKTAAVAHDLDFPSFFLPLQRSGVFMHTTNHPKISVLIQVARHLAQRLGAAPRELIDAPLERILPDGLIDGPVLPVYPEIAETFGLKGAYIWKFGSGHYLHGLRQYLKASFQQYQQQDTEAWVCPELQNPVCDQVLSSVCG